MTTATLQLDESLDLTPLAAALRQAGYRETLLAETTGIEPEQGTNLAIALRATAEAAPANTLIRLFALGCDESCERVEQALAPMSLEPLVRAGLLSRKDNRVRSEFGLQPFDEFWVAHDFPPHLARTEAPPDLVQGVTVASLMLANLTVRRPAERMLDVGCGGGVQMLKGGAHARSLVGTDLNPRALNLAAFNLRLNGCRAGDLRGGSLLDPVAGETFDLVVSNPPFAVSPEARFSYRDGAMPGDALCERLLRDIPGVLNDGGFATVLCDWFHSSDDDWGTRPRRWLAECGCDVWLLKFYTQRPVAYAANWSSTADRRAPDFGDRLDRYLAYYEELGAARFTRGAAVLRKRSGSNWFRTETIEHPENLHDAALQIERLFAAFDLLESLAAPEDLLQHRLALCKEHRLQHTLSCQQGTWNVESSVLEQTHGFRFPGNVDQLVGKLIAGCDGTRTLGEAVTLLARDLNVSPQQVAPSAAAVMATLLEKGFFDVAD